jgi:hypothetical protein
MHAAQLPLFDASGRQIGIHFGSPTWKRRDGSLVVGEVVSRSDAASAGAIPALLLRAQSDSAEALSPPSMRSLDRLTPLREGTACSS